MVEKHNVSKFRNSVNIILTLFFNIQRNVSFVCFVSNRGDTSCILTRVHTCEVQHQGSNKVPILDGFNALKIRIWIFPLIWSVSLNISVHPCICTSWMVEKLISLFQVNSKHFSPPLYSISEFLTFPYFNSWLFKILFSVWINVNRQPGKVEPRAEREVLMKTLGGLSIVLRSKRCLPKGNCSSTFHSNQPPRLLMISLLRREKWLGPKIARSLYHCRHHFAAAYQCKVIWSWYFRCIHAQFLDF